MNEMKKKRSAGKSANINISFLKKKKKTYIKSTQIQLRQFIKTQP